MTRIDTAEVGPAAFVVSATGWLDDAASVGLRDALIPVAVVDGALVMLDLTSTSGIDWSSLGVIASAAHLVRRRGENLVIVTRDPRVTTRFHDCGLDELVRFERSVADGFAHAV
jgi:anti-anti-sigma factor